MTSQSRRAASGSLLSVMVVSFRNLQILQELPDESYNNGQPSVPLALICYSPDLGTSGGGLWRGLYFGAERGRRDPLLFYTQQPRRGRDSRNIQDLGCAGRDTVGHADCFIGRGRG